MAELESQFKRAVEDFKAGRKAEARELLLDIVDKHERHEQAWLYLSALVDTLEEQQICLENVLEINPGNERARKGLDKVNAQLAARNQQAAARARTEAESHATDPATPFSSLDWDALSAAPTQGAAPSSALGGSGFGSFAGDPLLGGAPATPPPFGSVNAASGSAASAGGTDWFSLVESQSGEAAIGPALDPFATPPTGDWGRAPSKPSAPSTHGSGKQVNLPSEQEYDEWVEKLNLRTGGALKPPASSFEPPPAQTVPPFTPDAVGPFGETTYMLGADAPEPEGLLGDRARGFGGATFGSGAWGGAEPAAPTALDEPVLPVGSAGAEYSVAGSVASGYEAGSLFAEEDEEEQSPFETAVLYEPGEASDDEHEDLADLDLSFDFSGDAAQEERLSATRDNAAGALAGYFAMIPEDIQAPGRTGRRLLLAFVLLAMIAANAVSYYLLLR